MTNETNNRMIAASPQQMAQQAQQLRRSCTAIIHSLDNIRTYMSQISSYWDTEGADMLKDIFIADTKEAESLGAGLQRRLTDLDQIILNYESAENTSQEEASTLPDSIFN